MPPPTRAEAITTLEKGHAELARRLAGLSDQQLLRPGSMGGGWSAKQLYSHIAFWEELALEALNDWRAGRRPAVEAIFEQGSEGTDKANAEDEARWAERSLDEVRTRTAAAYQSLTRAIRDLSDEDWGASAPYQTSRRQTLAVLLGSVVGAPKRPFDHASAHLPDLDAYLASLQS